MTRGMQGKNTSKFIYLGMTVNKLKLDEEIKT
jgi:hypothetical protein